MPRPTTLTDRQRARLLAERESACSPRAWAATTLAEASALRRKILARPSGYWGCGWLAYDHHVRVDWARAWARRAPVLP